MVTPQNHFINLVGKNINLLLLLVLIVSLLSNFVIFRQSKVSSPPLCVSQYSNLKELKNYVDQAADLITSKGEVTFDVFRLENSKWRYANRYLFAYDMSGNILLHPPQISLEGSNIFKTSDSKGKFYFKEMTLILSNSSSGWIDYFYPQPDANQESIKLSYIKKIIYQDKPIIIGSGVYLD